MVLPFKIFSVIGFILVLLFSFGQDLRSPSYKFSRNSVIRRAAKKIYYQVAKKPELTVKLEVPYHRQEHSLSCEVATLVMALGFRGISVSEEELLSKVGVDPTPHQGNVWGNPSAAFVGEVDGRMGTSGYGVYWDRISNVAKQYRSASDSFSHANSVWLAKQIEAGDPVIVWGAVGRAKRIDWSTPDGQRVKAVYGEHTRVAIGFSGSVNNPSGFYLLDPIYGEVYFPRAKFEGNWALLDSSGVVIR